MASLLHDLPTAMFASAFGAILLTSVGAVGMTGQLVFFASGNEGSEKKVVETLENVLFESFSKT